MPAAGRFRRAPRDPGNPNGRWPITRRGKGLVNGGARMERRGRTAGGKGVRHQHEKQDGPGGGQRGLAAGQNAPLARHCTTMHHNVALPAARRAVSALAGAGRFPTTYAGSSGASRIAEVRAWSAPRPFSPEATRMRGFTGARRLWRGKDVPAARMFRLRYGSKHCLRLRSSAGTGLDESNPKAVHAPRRGFALRAL